MSSSEELKFMQVAEFEVRQERVSQFCTTADGNCIALLGTVADIPVLELQHHEDGSDPLPFFFSYVSIPSELPLSTFLEQIDMQYYYEQTSMLESQSISMEPVLMAHCIKIAPKMKLKELHFAPPIHYGAVQQLAVVTSYGACLVLAKETPNCRCWGKKLYDLNAMLCDDVYPLGEWPRDLPTFQDLKNVLYKYWITAFAWNNVPDKHMGYVANAAGYVIAFNFNVNTKIATLYCLIGTSLGHINCLKSFGNLLLASDVDGGVRLFRIDHEEKSSIKETAVLWNRKDRLGCRRAEVNFSAKLSNYVVAITKGAFLLIFRITYSGSIVSKASVRLNGIEITGLTTLSELEFIATTLVGYVWHIRIRSTVDGVGMHIETQVVPTDFDVCNMNLFAVETSRNRSLWTFLRYRNTEFKQGSKHSTTSAIVTICTLNNIDVLSRLKLPTHLSFDPLIDDMAALRLNIFKIPNRDFYKKFFDISDVKFPNKFTYNYLQQLQLALLIVSTFQKFEIHKMKGTKVTTQHEIDFLQRAVHMMHLLCRLKFLRNIKTTMTPFQLLAGRCMRSQFLILNEELKSSQALHDTIHRFGCFVAKAFNSVRSEKYSDIPELCSICYAPVNDATLMCDQKHKTSRCCISAVQLDFDYNDDMKYLPHPSPYLTLHCPQCRALAFNDIDKLKELLELNTPIMCTFCRVQFVKS